MFHIDDINNEEQLAHILARCGFPSAPPSQAPSHVFWKKEWRGRTIPIARYLLGFIDDYFVVVRESHFEVYVQDRQNYWFHCIGEIYNVRSEQELQAQLQALIY